MSTCFSEEFLVCDGSYPEIMNSTVLPWLKQREHPETVSGSGSRPLYTVSWQAENPVGTVFIVHGFTENAFKYAELIWSLLHLRYSVVAYDQRGHGRSWRTEGIKDSSVTHVDRFSDYVEDLHVICETYRSRMPEPFLLFAHSMGGAVGVLYLEQYPAFFSAAVLSSPMIAPDIGGIPPRVASALARFAGFIGKGKDHPFFMSPYSGPEDFDSSCATDAGRFRWYEQIKAGCPEFRNSVPSWQWSYEAVHVTEKILAPGAPEKIDCPVLLFSAGIDHSVMPEPQSAFIRRVRNGKLVPVPDAKHEIFRSENSVLFPWWHNVLSFYSDISSGLIRKGE